MLSYKALVKSKSKLNTSKMQWHRGSIPIPKGSREGEMRQKQDNTQQSKH
jgi:hypothetical protein